MKASTLIRAMFGGAEREERSTSFQQVWGSGGDWPGDVGAPGAVAALAIPALFGCVDILAGQIAAMPLQTFRAAGGVRERAGGVRERAPDGPLVTGPSVVWAPDEWVYVAAASMILHGEAIGLETQQAANGWPAKLEWVDPRTVDVRRGGAGVEYRIAGELLPSDRVTHVRHGVLLPGRLRGLSALEAMPSTLRSALAQIVFELDWFRFGGHPSGTINVDVDELPGDEAEVIKRRFMDAQRRRQPVVFTTGVTYTAQPADVSSVSLDAARSRVATDVAVACHVPPWMVGGDAGKSMTYSTLETDQAALDVRALMPIYSRLERALSRLTPRPYYLRFNADSSVRADLRTRAEVGEILVRSGQRSANELRAKDELPPVPGGRGDVFAAPPGAQVKGGMG